MGTKMKKRVYIVEMDDCFDYDHKRKIKVFSTYEKAKIYYNKILNEFKNSDCKYSSIDEGKDYYCGCDEGWYERDHFDISITHKIVE